MSTFLTWVLKLSVFGVNLCVVLYVAASCVYPGHTTPVLWIGPSFGLVILVWSAQRLRELVTWRSGAFLIFSSLAMGLAWLLGLYGVWLAYPLLQALGVEENQLERGTFELIGIVMTLGGLWISTAILAVAHGALLRTSWQRVKMAICCIVIASCAAILVQRDFLDGGLFIPEVASWQVLYLLAMFGRLPRQTAGAAH